MWIYCAVFVVALVAQYALSYYQEESIPSTNAKASDSGGVSAPTAAEGGEIPVLFGTREIGNANVVWWGDFGAEATY